MPRVARLALVLAGPLVLWGLASARQEPARAEPTVRVGTWNIAWLGNKERRKNQPEAKDLAAYLAASKVDLLGLNEISHTGEGGDPPTNATLTEALQLLAKETGKTWKHLLFPKDVPPRGEAEDDFHKHQLCGIAWNESVVKLMEKPYRLPIRRGPAVDKDAFHRPVFAVKFALGEKKSDLVLIPLHLKSNALSRATNRGGVTQMSKVRAEEARGIVRVLGAVQNHFNDDDVVLLGDLNCLLREEPALAQFRATGYRDLNFEDQLTWIRERNYDPAPFDRILVPAEQPEFRRSGFTVLRESAFNSEREFRERLSDHYLVYTDVAIQEDDD